MPNITAPLLIKTTITLGQMRAMGTRRLVVSCQDPRCGHWSTLNADRWGDHLRLSEVAPKLVCHRCGQRGSELTPDFPKIAAAAN